MLVADHLLELVGVLVHVREPVIDGHLVVTSLDVMHPLDVEAGIVGEAELLGQRPVVAGVPVDLADELAAAVELGVAGGA